MPARPALTPQPRPPASSTAGSTAPAPPRPSPKSSAPPRSRPLLRVLPHASRSRTFRSTRSRTPRRAPSQRRSISAGRTGGGPSSAAGGDAVSRFLAGETVDDVYVTLRSDALAVEQQIPDLAGSARTLLAALRETDGDIGRALHPRADLGDAMDAHAIVDEDVPAGTFRESGTDVGTVLLVLRRPE